MESFLPVRLLLLSIRLTKLMTDYIKGVLFCTPPDNQVHDGCASHTLSTIHC